MREGAWSTSSAATRTNARGEHVRALAVAVDAHGHVAIWVCLDRGGNTTIRGKYVMQWDYAGSFPVRIMIKGGKSIHIDGLQGFCFCTR